MRCLLVAAAAVAVSARAYAGNPLEKPAFTATPQELLDAAKAEGGSGSVTLRNEVELSFDDAGKLTRRLHYIAVARTAESAAGWSQVALTFQPWRQATPTLRSRAISATGEVHELDPATLVDEPERVGEIHQLRGKVAITAGSIVEEESVTIDNAPTPGGRIMVLDLDYATPMRAARVTISAPIALKAKVVVRALPKTAKVQHTTTGARETWTYELSLPGMKKIEDVPLDVFVAPQISVSLAHSWGDVAKAYRALVEPKLTMTLPAELHAGDTLDNARAITAWLHQHVTYSGGSLGYEPAEPTHVDDALKRGTGSTADLAILETALLRAAGIKAELVLVDRGPHRGGNPDTPGLEGFDHVLVRATIRGAETWIEPEDPDLAVGQLRVSDQARPALAITRGTWFETPQAPASANSRRTNRTVELARIGFGNVTESFVETGELDRARRQWLRGSDVRAEIQKDRELRYGGELTAYSATAPDDHGTPVEMTYTMTGATHVETTWTHASAFLHPVDLFEQLPAELYTSGTPERTVDLRVGMPYVSEATTRFVVPDGFLIPAPQPERKRPIGALTLVETQRIEGRTLIVTQRLEVAKTRLTAAEVNETRSAITALDFEHFVFEHEAWALAEHGKYREAVAKMNASLAAQPRNSFEHARFAVLLVLMGDGEGARREAHKAVELAPKDADAHYALGLVLTYDLVGRQWAVGFDREGARTELALAHSLAPKHFDIAFELASVLSHGTRGRLYGTGSDMRAAAAAWREAYEQQDSPTNARELLRALLWSGDAAGTEALAAKMPPFNERAPMILAAAALAHGPEAALRDVDAADRDKTVQTAASLLTVMRHYDVAKQLLLKAAVTGSDRQLEFVDKLAGVTVPKKRTADPISVGFDYLAEQLDPGAGGAIFWDKDTAKEAHIALRSYPIPPEATQMTTPVMMDMAHALGFVSVDGDANAWRVTLEMHGHKDFVYLAADHGVPKVIGFPASYAGIGRHVLRLMGKHDDAARRLLDWIASDLPRHSIHNVWSDALPKDTVHETLAAALLAHDPDREIAAGTACGMTTVEGQNVCDQMVARGLRARGKWSELESYAAAWIARAPAAYVVDATTNRAIALAELGRFDEAEKLVEDTLATHPDNYALLYMRINLAVWKGPHEEIAKRADAAAKTATPTGLNNIAWLEYSENVDMPGALEHARKAFELAPKDGFIANTLAALEEASGDSKAAIDHMHAALELAHKEEPSDGDWYVLGRIYEDCGLRDDAIAAYRRITPDKFPDVLPTTYSMATARLKALGAPKK